RPGQLRPAVAARGRLPGALSRHDAPARDAARARAAPEGARRPDAAPDSGAGREAAPEHAGARAAREPDGRGRVEAVAPARRDGPADNQARGLLRRLLARAGEAGNALRRARPSDRVPAERLAVAAAA